LRTCGSTGRERKANYLTGRKLPPKRGEWELVRFENEPETRKFPGETGDIIPGMGGTWGHARKAARGKSQKVEGVQSETPSRAEECEGRSVLPNRTGGTEPIAKSLGEATERY